MGFERLARGPVSRQATGAVEDRQGAVGILMRPHRGLDVVVAVGRNLQRHPLVAHAVVIADKALFLHAQMVVRRASEGNEGPPSASKRSRQRRKVRSDTPSISDASSWLSKPRWLRP